MDSSAAASLKVTLYHNPNCSKSRGALELLRALVASKDMQLDVIEYLDNPPSKVELATLLTQLPNAPAELVRNDKYFKALALNSADYQTTEQVIALLQAHPELMQRPVALHNGKAAIGRPPEDLAELFS